MTVGTASTYDMITDRSPAWGAVLAMSLCCMVLVASEFMPVSLLTPIAADLYMTEGQAGQAISVSGIFAVLTSLSIAGLTSRCDRRTVLLALDLSLIVSGTVVALAPNYTILMTGRAVLGIAIGGFWSMSAAAVMRLVPEDSGPRALAILQGGTALSSIALVWLLAKLPYLALQVQCLEHLAEPDLAARRRSRRRADGGRHPTGDHPGRNR